MPTPLSSAPSKQGRVHNMCRYQEMGAAGVHGTMCR